MSKTILVTEIPTEQKERSITVTELPYNPEDMWWPCSLAAKQKMEMEGLTPESWLCIDCGGNTAPGMPARVEAEAAFASGKGITPSFTAESEVYTVREKVWAAAGMEPMGGCLCIGCLEKRLGRTLRPKDFQRGDDFNDPRLPGSPRLLKRRGSRKNRPHC